MYKGFLVTLEGIDGCGKSTQLNLLAKALEQTGHTVFVTKEPGDAKAGSELGPGIRQILFKEPGTAKLAPAVGDLLFLADHIQNVANIREHLKAGSIVLCDRYADSQFAYAASPSKKAPAWVNRLFQDHYGPVPDLTFLFHVRGPLQGDGMEDISWALRRANARRGVEAGKQDGKAWNAVEAQRTIQEAYLFNLLQESRTHIVHVYEDSTIENIQAQLHMAVEAKLAAKNEKQPVLPMYEQVA